MTDDDVDLLKERPPNRRGRPKGSKNKCKDPAIRAETRVAMAQVAQIHGPKAISTLVEIMLNKKAPHASRVAAAGVLLDRGYGKAPQAITGDVNVSYQIGDTPLSNAEWIEKYAPKAGSPGREEDRVGMAPAGGSTNGPGSVSTH